jgi:uncharacterized protein (DUF488 family)
MLATIGYERSSLADFVATLVHSEIEILIDIRDRAQSRMRGFSKSALSEALKEAGIGYVHFRQLGDPKEGRDAAGQEDTTCSVRFSVKLCQLLVQKMPFQRYKI